MAVILVALFGNLIAASGVGVALAVFLFIREQTRSTVIRSRIDGEQFFARNTRFGPDQSAAASERGQIVVFELQGSLFFGTANQLYKALEPETVRCRYVILSMRRVQSLDVTATHVLEQIQDGWKRTMVTWCFATCPKACPADCA
jgi:SulP family sulfate permease